MKRFRLWFERVRASFFSDLLIFFLVLLTLFFFVFSVGRYRYLTRSLRVIEDAGFANAVYFAQYYDLRESPTGEDTRALVRTTEEYGGVSYVASITSATVTCDGKLLSLLICPEGLQHLFAAPTAGVWDIAPGAAVVERDALPDRKPGDSLTITMAQGNISAVLRVSGVLESSGLLPQFGTTSSQLSTDNFFMDCDAIVVGENEITEQWLAEYPGYFSTGSNFIVKFEENATDTQKEEVRKMLRERGVCYEMQDIVERTKTRVANECEQFLLRPLFYVLIAMISFFGVSILSVCKRVRREAVYFLLGYPRGRMIRSAVGHVGLLIAVAAGINLALLALHAAEKINLGDRFLLDSFTIWMVLLAALGLLLLTAGAVIAEIKRKTPVALLRDSRE